MAIATASTRGSLQDVVEVVGDLDGRIAALHAGQALRSEVADRDQPRARRFAEVANQVRTPVAVADDRNADHLILPDARPGRLRFDGRILGATDDPGRHAGDDRVVRHVARHDRAGADERAFADGDAGENRGVAADRGAALAPVSARRSSRRRSAGCRPALTARGCRSLVNITPWPTKTPSSIVTPSQMKVWLEILQLRPIDGVLLDLDERADP